MKLITLISLIVLLILSSCTHDELSLPNIPPAEEQSSSYEDPEYVQLNPPLDAANGYNFNQPSGIYYGIDNFLYIADTDNNRIVMMDAGGTIQGVSQFIEHPEAITQNDSLQLLVVNKTNRVFRIKLFEYNHQIGSAPIDTVFTQASRPARQFTGITVYNGFEYYVTVMEENSTQLRSFIYDFWPDHKLKGPLPFEENGSGLFSVLKPTAIVSVRERYLDISSNAEDTKAFLFCQTGFSNEFGFQSYYKVQSIATTLFEGQEILIPNTILIGTDIYDFEKYYNPQDITIDRSGFVFVVDAGPDTSQVQNSPYQPGFYRFAPSGKQQQAVLGLGSGEAKFNNPGGIAVSPIAEVDQIVYVADKGNNRILLFQLSSEL